MPDQIVLSLIAESRRLVHTARRLVSEEASELGGRAQTAMALLIVELLARVLAEAEAQLAEASSSSLSAGRASGGVSMGTGHPAGAPQANLNRTVLEVCEDG